MASRLSEEALKAVYDAGTSALLVQPEPELALLEPREVDLDALLSAEDPEAAVQAVDALALYGALKRRGVEDSLEILPLMSADQVVRTFDFEAWDGDQLAPLKMFQWLAMFKEVSGEELAKRFRELDEEYQIGLLGPLITLADEDEFEKIGHDEQDQYTQLPSHDLYYKVNAPDPRLGEHVDSLVEAMLSVDINYAYSMLAHAANLPPAESEAQLVQFRKARLEEEGFVTYEESLEAFRPIDMKPPTPLDDAAALVAKPVLDGPFLVHAMRAGARVWTAEQYDRVMTGLAFLSNNLAAAAKLEPDDQAGLKRLMHQAQALVGVGLEWQAARDPEAAARVLAATAPKVLFRTGLTLVRELQAITLTRLERAGYAGAESLTRLWDMGRNGALLTRIEHDLLPVLGLQRVEVLKGLFNRFPVRPENDSRTQKPRRERTGEGEGQGRIVFKPITSLNDLAALAAAVDGIGGLLHLVSVTSPKGTPLLDLDRQLTTAMARVLIGGPFMYAPLNAAELERLVAVPREAAQAFVSDLFAGMEGTLSVAVMDREARGSQGVAGAPSGAKAALTATFAELSDLAMRLAMARESDRRAGGPSAVLGLVDVAEQTRQTSAAAEEKA